MGIRFDVLKGISTRMSGRGDFHSNIVSWLGVISCLSVSGFNFVAKWQHVHPFNLFCIRESRLNLQSSCLACCQSYRDPSTSNFISFILHLHPSVSQLSRYLSWLAASKWKRVSLALQTGVELHLNTQANMSSPCSIRFLQDLREIEARRKSLLALNLILIAWMPPASLRLNLLLSALSFLIHGGKLSLRDLSLSFAASLSPPTNQFPRHAGYNSVYLTV